MKAEDFVNILGADFYTGVPDSQLKALCNYLMNRYGIDSHHHIIAANEGNCVALAAGYHLATGGIPVVYMQNSGEGNIVNPAASLLHDRVYAIPMIFVIGWRGEPGVHDEPQHIYQGEITCRLLQDLGISHYIIDKETTDEEAEECMNGFQKELAQGKDVAFVIRKGALQYDGTVIYQNDNILRREEIIRCVVQHSGNDPIVSTTGKASRELFEIRTGQGQSHERDFLTVGSMGHCSSIAMGVALHRPDKTIWCIDGDGAALMHMGAMPVIADRRPRNLIHIIINNGAHETVGGQPTVMGNLKFSDIARSCGYPYAVTVDNLETLRAELAYAKERKDLSLIEVKCGIGSREDLGRPTTTAKENKESYMRFLMS